MPLVNASRRVGRRLGPGRKRRLEHRIANVAAAHLVAPRQCPEIDVRRKGRARRMYLHAPNLRALGSPWHLEENVCPYSPLEGRVEVRRQVRGEDNHAVVPLELLQMYADDGVRLPLKYIIYHRRTARRIRDGFDYQ